MERISEDSALPALREDLRIRPGPSTPDGVPTWTIHDPVRNKYFQIGWVAFHMLSRWVCGSTNRLVEEISSTTTCQVTHKDVEELVKFLYANSLTRESPTGDNRGFAAQAQAGRTNWLTWLVHNYLFIRIPLVRPDRFLRATLPFVSPLFTRTVGILVLLSGIIGLYLVGRQWETFTNTFLYFFTVKGLVVYGLALCVIKILHELGHAYTATRYGCRVPTMGIAFLVLFPVLYTDTTEAWRLTSRRQRFFIGAAGMMTELALAMLATLFWNFLPDGMLRSVAFVVATTSWLVGITINLNPFLRFDGYYILSDWLGVPNLQERSFALGRWKLRQLLFATEESPPEKVSSTLRKQMIIYAWAVWIFRFFLFIGIAVLVYHFFFKLLGVFLFAIEILWFIVLPIAREIKVWWNMKGTITETNRFWVSSLGFIALVVLAFVPWNTRVSVPAVLEATEYATIFAPAPGRIVDVSIKEGQHVMKGDVLLTLEAPAIENEIVLTEKRIEVLELRKRRQAANPEELADSQVVAKELETRISELKGLLERRDNLVLAAPISGVVTDLADSLHPRRWVNEKLPLAYLVEPGETELHALAPEIELSRLEVGQMAKFFPDDPTRPSMKARIQEVRQVDDGIFTIPYLASIYGGEIAVRQDEQGKLQPETSVYRVQLGVLENQPMWNQAVRGVIHVAGRPRSFAGWVRDLVVALLIRESGF